MSALQPCPMCHAGEGARWRCAFCSPAAERRGWPVWAVSLLAVALLVAATVFGVEAVLLGVVDGDPAWRYAAAAAGAAFVAAILAGQVGHLLGALDEARELMASAEATAHRAARFAAQLAATQPIDLALTRAIPVHAPGPRRARRPDAGRVTLDAAIAVGLLLVLAATFYGLLGGLWQHVVDPICQAAPAFCGGSR